MSCKTCKFWSKDPREYKQLESKYNFRACSKMRMYDDVIVINYDNKSISVEDDVLAYVEDASAYYAAFITNEKFSCILWELDR